MVGALDQVSSWEYNFQHAERVLNGWDSSWKRKGTHLVSSSGSDRGSTGQGSGGFVGSPALREGNGRESGEDDQQGDHRAPYPQLQNRSAKDRSGWLWGDLPVLQLHRLRRFVGSSQQSVDLKTRRDQVSFTRRSRISRLPSFFILKSFCGGVLRVEKRGLFGD